MIYHFSFYYLLLSLLLFSGKHFVLSLLCLWSYVYDKIPGRTFALLYVCEVTTLS